MPHPPPLSASGPLLEQVSPNLAQELGRYLTRHRREVEAMILTAGREAGLPAAQRHAKVYDGLLSSLFHAVKAAMTVSGDWVPLTLAAVGSYGRGAVAYHSDLDVRLLATGTALEKAQPLAEALLYPLWDGGIDVGHQVVGVDGVIDLAREDLPTATSLLDWRVIAGDTAGSDALMQRVFEGLFGIGEIGGFLGRLAERAEARRQRFGGSVYLLEPDVKNGPGGLRDLDVAHWAARARYRVTDLGALVRLGVLVPREWQEIDRAQSFLWRVRNLLHVHAGRRSDRLSFDRQEQLSEDLGYGSGGPAVERFMSDYYRNARSIERARDMVLSRAAPPPTRRPHASSLGRGISLVNGAVSLAHPAALEAEPALALRVYDEAVRRGLPVYHYARDAIARATSLPGFCERLRASDEAARLFVRLVSVVQRSRFRNGSVIGELHDVGLLLAMIPEFSPVVGRVHHDVYHVYTVDAHSVAALDRLRELSRGDLTTEHPLASRLAAEIARPHVVFLATLLHDVGKDIGGKSHSERGHDMAHDILGRLGLPESEIREVQHLILQHLRMYHTATRRDIDDPATIDDFCGHVHGVEGLRELYLLTVADLSTTSPTALTSWKARMLDELFVACERRLSEGPGEELGLEEKIHDVTAAWDGVENAEFLSRYLHSMPRRYLHANEVADIVSHAFFAERTREQHVGVDVLAVDEPYVELGVVADDRPGLLAIFTAALAAARLSVVGAQICSFTDPSGRVRALDLFWVKSSADADAVRAQLRRVERDITRMLAGEVKPAELVGGTRSSQRSLLGRTPAVPTKVSTDDRATAHTVIEVTTRDRPALLFWLAHALQEAGLTISLAKINTEGTRVADVFYVTDASGAKLSDPRRIEELKARILSTVAELEAMEVSS